MVITSVEVLLLYALKTRSGRLERWFVKVRLHFSNTKVMFLVLHINLKCIAEVGQRHCFASHVTRKFQVLAMKSHWFTVYPLSGEWRVDSLCTFLYGYIYSFGDNIKSFHVKRLKFKYQLQESLVFKLLLSNNHNYAVLTSSCSQHLSFCSRFHMWDSSPQQWSYCYAHQRSLSDWRQSVPVLSRGVDTGRWGARDHV